MAWMRDELLTEAEEAAARLGDDLNLRWTALGVPIVVLPFVNSALGARAPFRRSVENLRSEGVHVLLGIGGVEPHGPHTGGELIASYPWHPALIEAGRLADLADSQ